MATITLTRTFRFGAVDLPDPDSRMSPEDVLEHYSRVYPTLRHGKVIDDGVQGDTYVWKLQANEYKANG